jgi:hypothetical protein
VRENIRKASLFVGLPGFVVLAAVILILWLHDCDPQRNASVEETTIVPS